MKKWLLVTLSLSFWENVWLYWHQEKKIPQTICAKSHLSQALGVEFQAAPFKDSTAAEQTAQVFCL